VKQSTVGFRVTGSALHRVCIPVHTAALAQEHSTQSEGSFVHAKLTLPPGPSDMLTQNSPFPHTSDPHCAVAQ
jgi:hypothetical protein